MSFLLFYHIAVLAILGLMLLTVMINLTVFHTLRRGEKPRGSLPKLSILVPARNEERSIGDCLASLKAQDYPDFELILLDDHSTDRTAEIARETGLEEDGGRFRMLRGEALPGGWTGKGWACWQLAAQAKGEYILFVDADTWHAPETARTAVAHAERTGASLLSAWPRLVTLTWSERLVIPLIPVLAFAIYPHVLIVLLQRFPALARLLGPGRLRSLGAANGQFMLFQREAYDAIGGHQAVRDHVVEDVALGRAVAEKIGDGLRLVNCDGSRLANCRMYRAFPEVWDGFTKNIRAAFEGSLAGFLVSGLIQFCGLLLPFGFLFYPGPYLPLVIVQVALIYLIRVLITMRLRTSWFGCVFHPFGLMIALCIALNSWRRTTGEGVVWKDRTYLGKSAEE